MHAAPLWRPARALLLTGLIAAAATGLAGDPTTATAPVALASVAAQNDNDDDEDRVLRGQVVSPAPGVLPAIERSTNPPVLFVANIDGIVTVLVTDPAELSTSGVQPGDHVRLDGEKVTELLFEAADIEVTDRLGGDNDNGE